jgi:hypothetical protein
MVALKGSVVCFWAGVTVAWREGALLVDWAGSVRGRSLGWRFARTRLGTAGLNVDAGWGGAGSERLSPKGVGNVGKIGRLVTLVFTVNALDLSPALGEVGSSVVGWLLVTSCVGSSRGAELPVFVRGAGGIVVAGGFNTLVGGDTVGWGIWGWSSGGVGGDNVFNRFKSGGM